MKKNDMVTGEKEILKAAMRERGMTQIMLADKMGIRQNSLSGNLSRDRMSLGTFGKVLNILGYDVVILDRESGEIAWKLEVEK